MAVKRQNKAALQEIRGKRGAAETAYTAMSPMTSPSTVLDFVRKMISNTEM
jgi:hypothetical protein